MFATRSRRSPPQGARRSIYGSSWSRLRTKDTQLGGSSHTHPLPRLNNIYLAGVQLSVGKYVPHHKNIVYLPANDVWCGCENHEGFSLGVTRVTAEKAQTPSPYCTIMGSAIFGVPRHVLDETILSPMFMVDTSYIFRHKRSRGYSKPDVGRAWTGCSQPSPANYLNPKTKQRTKACSMKRRTSLVLPDVAITRESRGIHRNTVVGLAQYRKRNAIQTHPWI